MAENKTTAGVEIQVKASDQAGSVKTIRAELKEATMQAVLLARQFGENSKEATAAAQKVANLRDEIEDAGLRIKSLNPDKFQRIATLTQGAAQGFVAAQGAMALFGGKSEELEKQMVKLQGAIALSQGLQGIKDLSLQFGGLKDLIVKQVVTAFSTLKGAIMATGIGALVVGIGLLVANFEKVKEAVLNFIPGLAKVADTIMDIVHATTDFLGLTSEQERQIEKLEEANKALNTETERQIKIMEASGASAEDLYWKKKELWQREVEALEKKKAANIKLTDEETKKLYDLWTQYYVDDAARKKRIDDEAKARLDAANKERLDLINEANKDVLDATKDAVDERQKLETDKANQEIAIDKAKVESQKELDKLLLEDRIKASENYKQLLNDEKDYLAATVKAKQELRNTEFDGVLALINLGEEFATKNKNLQNALFIAEKAAAIAKIIINTQTEIAGYYANPTWKLLPDGGLALASAASLNAKIRAGIGIATIAGTTIAKFMGGGGGETGGGAGSFNAPTPNIGGNLAGSVNNTRQNIEGFSTNSTGGGTGTIKVYVTETDISKAQSRINAIKNRAQIK